MRNVSAPHLSSHIPQPRTIHGHYTLPSNTCRLINRLGHPNTAISNVCTYRTAELCTAYYMQHNGQATRMWPFKLDIGGRAVQRSLSGIGSLSTRAIILPARAARGRGCSHAAHMVFSDAHWDPLFASAPLAHQLLQVISLSLHNARPTLRDTYVARRTSRTALRTQPKAARLAADVVAPQPLMALSPYRLLVGLHE